MFDRCAVRKFRKILCEKTVVFRCELMRVVAVVHCYS